MFSTRSIILFAVSALLIFTAYLCMAFDPEANGFGIATLWVAPPLLLLGFLLPVLGIMGIENIKGLEKSRIQWFSWKNAIGLLVFFIALITYLITLEPTASLWDCAEFIASAYKLQVPHTPGTPLSLLFGRLFSMLAPDVQQVAWFVNSMSAFFSALAVFIVYHIIIHFGTKIMSPQQGWHHAVLILASLCGSLCLTFSDTFWYTAVEAETYGIASFFLLLLIWIMLKAADSEEFLRTRLFILLAYMSGLAYCIHPMCLLVLPILPFIWYTKDKQVRLLPTLLKIGLGLVLVLLINRFIAIGIFDLAFTFDRIAVNNMRLPFYSGVFILLFVLVIACYFLLTKLSKYKMYTWAVIFLILGFLPYLMLFIRSNHNPPIDETNPEDLYQIKAYMNRESYPSSPLVYGPYFDAKIENVTTKNKAYYKDNSGYSVAGSRANYVFEKSRQTILPRMYSRDAHHVEAYRQWMGMKPNEKPNFIHNIKFMLNYQVGHMYFRYLLWNFVGRASDIQDSVWLKPWDRLSKGNFERARNQYWMIPLMLGLIGAWSQFRKDKKGFIVNLVFFLCTGLILALYLNSPPIEPRERDYIYVASYIAFAIWVGLGLLSIVQLFRRPRIAMTLGAVIGLLLPAWMCYQNYDDHTRAGRTFQMDYAKAMLNTCAPNAVLFTGGDNDTFPLWYLQEVEGFRTDVRVVVLSYFNTDWYINQLRKQYYNSAPLQLTLTEKDYRQYGLNDILYIDDKIKQGIDVQQYLSLISAEHPALKVVTGKDDAYHLLPSRLLKLKTSIDSTETLSLKVSGNYLEKNALAILDLLVSNGWKRPFYFNVTSMNSLGIELEPYLVQEGLLYRLTPVRSENGSAVNTDLTYKNLIELADFSNLADKQVNFNYEDYHARMIVPLRQAFNTLAEAYILEGNNEKAAEVIKVSLEKLHYSHLLPSFTDLYVAELLIELGNIKLAKDFTVQIFNFYYDQAKRNLDKNKTIERLDQYMLRQSAVILNSLGDPSYNKTLTTIGL
jgi:hypothetical protein